MTTIRRYTAIIERGQDGWLVVHFPALPGVWTQGRTREEALSNAQEALELTIESMVEEGEAVPDEDGAILEVAI